MKMLDHKYQTGLLCQITLSKVGMYYLDKKVTKERHKI